VSDRPLPSPVHSRQAAKRFRRRGRRLARQLLDEAYAQYLSGLPSSQDCDSSNNINDNDDSNISVPSPPPPPPLRLPSPPPNQVPSPSPSFEDPDSPHSALTQRIFPDSPPPSIRSLSPPSYSPISSPEPSPRPPSPTGSTSSVEFIDEVPIPPPRPRYYYHYDPNQPLDILILQFPPRTSPVPPGSYTIGPDHFDLNEIRQVIVSQDPDSIIPVFLPNHPSPYNVPVRFFHNLFPPSTAIIKEID